MPRVVVPPGSTDITITGVFGSTYDVLLSAGWPTETPWTRATDSFLVTFTTLAPPAPDNVLTYVVVGASAPGPPSPGASTLSSYLADVRRFLRSRTGDQLYDDVDLIAFINRAMRQRDLDLGLNRSLVRFTLTPGVPRYSIPSIVSGGTVIDGNPVPNPIDCMGVVYTPQGGTPAGGGYRVPLGRKPYSWVSALLSTSYRSLPLWYAIYGATGSVVIAPVPMGAYYTEFDFYCYASDLVNATDADPLGYPWTDPVPFQAAALAKDQAQRYDEAKEWEALYRDRLNRVRSRGRPLAVANPMADLPGAYR